MLLIDALYINNGGGKILLNYLVDRLEKEGLAPFYLFDERCKNDFSQIPENRKIFMRASLWARHKFYKDNYHLYSKVLCFGNLSPTIKLGVPIYTYFHQTLYLNIPKEFSLKDRIGFKIKTYIFKELLSNTSKLLVQNEIVKEESIKKLPIEASKIICIPFYPNEDLIVNRGVKKEKYSFIYVSSGYPHKNHLNLIAAFCKFHDTFGVGKLILTVDVQQFKALGDLIDQKTKVGYPIVNIGFVNRTSLIQYYGVSEYLVFPSLEESFGLGIVEAIDSGCKVIGSNLPYLHQVCNPSLMFDPLSVESIFTALAQTVDNVVPPTEKKINNRIADLIELLK